MYIIYRSDVQRRAWTAIWVCLARSERQAQQLSCTVCNNCRMTTISVRIEKSGRILIPASIRRRLQLTEGSQVLIHVDDTNISLGTREQALLRIRDRLRKYIPAGSDVSGELLADRRRAAERENAK